MTWASTCVGSSLTRTGEDESWANSSPTRRWWCSTNDTLHCSRRKRAALRRYTVGHEVGHWELHAETIRSGTVSLFDGTRIWCRDGSQDPIERQAEMFSAALLMPRDQLLGSLPKSPWQGWSHVYRLADEFLVNPTPMAIRLEKLGWMHREDDVPVSGPRPAPGQDSLF